MSDRNAPAEGIYTRRLRHRTEHVVVIVLTADEAENIADALGRTAAMVELDPPYADVIARRWQEHTGVLPTREDGTPVDFTTKAR